MSLIVLIHITAAMVGLLSGYMAMLVRKGSGLHGAAGSVFFWSMLVMTTSAAYGALFIKPVMLNFLVAVLTFYLVVTAWRAAKHRDGRIGMFDHVALLLILADAVAGIGFGFQAANSPRGMKDGMPAAGYFIFGSIALMCAITDVRMIKRGGVTGPRRLVRHLWRMCAALLIATLSFYPGQARQFPASVRGMAVVYLPHLFLFGSMVFWRWRMSRRKRAQEEPPAILAAAA